MFRIKQFLNFVLMLSLTLLGLLLVTFFIGRLMPIDPVLSIIGESRSQELYDQVYLKLGLDKPLVVQFWYYIKGVLSGDLGDAILTNRSVLTDIKTFFPATIELATVAIFWGVIIGVPLGIWAAIKQNKLSDTLIRFFGLVGYSAPIFWLGYMGILIFYKELSWVAAPEGRLSVVYEYTIPAVTNMVLIDTLLAGSWDAFKDALLHLALPAFLLAYYSIAYISRMTRSFMIEELSQEYIVAARIKGLSEWRILFFHALRNASIPLITVVVLSYASLLEGSVITEVVFSWPGIGRYITNALLSNDMNAVLGGTIVVGCVFVFLNLFSDFLYKIIDPRAK